MSRRANNRVTIGGRHPAFPSNEAEAAIEAARQEVATVSEAEKWFASQPTDSRKKEISE